VTIIATPAVTTVASPVWQQSYNPSGHLAISALCAAAPLLVLLIVLVALRWRAHLAALTGLAVCVALALSLFHMPAKLIGLATIYGAAYGVFPIFWVIFPVLFLYRLTVAAGRFDMLQCCISGLAEDSRLQLLLIAFALGGFFEGAAGFGTPVAVCATLLVGLGFKPIRAAGLTLMANTAPVAFGGLGIPVLALSGVTGLSLLSLTRVIAALLAPFCVLVPFWLIFVFCGFDGMMEIWPAILVTGGTFSVVQFLIGTFHGPWLVDISASLASILALMLLLRVWKPKRILDADGVPLSAAALKPKPDEAANVRAALLPWVILTAAVTLWGIPSVSHWFDKIGSVDIPIVGLHHAVARMPPVVAQPFAEPAIFHFNLLSATGTGIMLAAFVAAFAMGLGPRQMLAALMETVRTTRFTLITISALMALGFVSRYCGMDATLGLAFAKSGQLYPFFAVLIGWIGTASTGSDTSSNVLFGSVQKLSALQLGLSPLLLCAANSAGGVMGKMIATQNVVVASTATGSYGQDSKILRFVILQSVALVVLVGLLVLAVARLPALARAIGAG
jgi:lactate permease